MRLVPWLRSVFVCPCSRCRDERRDELEGMTASEAAAWLHEAIASGRLRMDTSGSGAAKWRAAIERHTSDAS